MKKKNVCFNHNTSFQNGKSLFHVISINVSTYFLLRSRQIRFFVVCLSKKGLLLLTVKCLAEIKFVLQYGSVCEAKNIRKNERLRERESVSGEVVRHGGHVRA